MDLLKVIFIQLLYLCFVSSLSISTTPSYQIGLLHIQENNVSSSGIHAVIANPTPLCNPSRGFRFLSTSHCTMISTRNFVMKIDHEQSNSVEVHGSITVSNVTGI